MRAVLCIPCLLVVLPLVRGQGCNFEASWLGTWFHYYDQTTGNPWTYEFKQGDDIKWELQNGQGNVFLKLQCYSTGVALADLRYYLLSALFSTPVCMQTTKTDVAILLRDQALPALTTTDYPAVLQTCPQAMDSKDKAQWFVKYPFVTSGVSHPYPTGTYQATYSTSLGIVKCTGDTSSLVLVDDEGFTILTCYTGANTYMLPLNRKRLLLQAWTPGSKLEDDSNGDVALLTDMDDTSHPYFYCARIRVAGGSIFLSLDVQDSLEPECVSGHMATTAVQDKYLALTLITPSSATATPTPEPATTLPPTTTTPVTTTTPLVTCCTYVDTTPTTIAVTTTPSPPVTPPPPATPAPITTTTPGSRPLTTPRATTTPLVTTTPPTTTTRVSVSSPATTPTKPAAGTTTTPVTTTTPPATASPSTTTIILPSGETVTTPAPQTTTTPGAPYSTTTTSPTEQTASPTASPSPPTTTTTPSGSWDLCGGCVPLQGSCKLFQDGSKGCWCFIGFAGILCEHVDACLSNPCQNNGTCVARHDVGYNCMCRGVYYGDHCELMPDDVPPEPEEQKQSMVMVVLIAVLVVLILAVCIIAGIICKRKKSGEMMKPEKKKKVVGESSGAVSRRTTSTTVDNASLGTGSATQWYPNYTYGQHSSLASYPQMKGNQATAMLLLQQPQQQQQQQQQQ